MLFPPAIRTGAFAQIRIKTETIFSYQHRATGQVNSDPVLSG